MTRSQDGMTCCDEARADGRNDFVAFIRAVEKEVEAAVRRAQGDVMLLSSLVADAFDKFDVSSGERAAQAPTPVAATSDGSRKFKFSTSRATLRVKTTVEVLIKYESTKLQSPYTTRRRCWRSRRRRQQQQRRAARQQRRWLLPSPSRGSCSRHEQRSRQRWAAASCG
jgi:hypothetical protein